MENLENKEELHEEIKAEERTCPSCGASVTGVQKFCNNCGTNLSEPHPAKAKEKNKTQLILSVIAIVSVLAVAVFFINQSSGPNFKKIYEQYCDSEWAKVGDDGSYLSIDTNPKNKDNTGIDSKEAYYAISYINSALGIPESLMNDIGKTSGIDGRQTETFEDKNVTVTWKYHPDTGLEVTYKKIK